MRKYIFSTLLLVSIFVQSESVDVGRFTEVTDKTVDPWQVVRFDEGIPPTGFKWVNWKGEIALEAVADQSMALMARPVEINLNEYPILCWKWWIDSTVEKADLKKKSGDDYAARLYITFDLPDELIDVGTSIKLSLARAIYGDQVPEAAINYVWDNQYPVGTQEPNVYTDRAQMLVLETGNEKAKRWVKERRNVYRDVNKLFKAKKAKLIQLAVATDTDNTGTKARALFADLHFVKQSNECQWKNL